MFTSLKAQGSFVSNAGIGNGAAQRARATRNVEARVGTDAEPTPPSQPLISDLYGQELTFPKPMYKQITIQRPPAGKNCGLYTAMSWNNKPKVGAYDSGDASSASSVTLYGAKDLATAKDMVECFNGRDGDTDTCSESGNGDVGTLEVAKLAGFREPPTQATLTSAGDSSSASIRL